MTTKRQTAKDRTPDRPDGRIPVSGKRDILTVQRKNPAYKYRWVSDIPGRIERFKLGGWELETGDVGAVGQRKADSSTGTSSVIANRGGSTTQYLMRIKREWYEEDRKARDVEVDKSEEALKRNMKQTASDGGYGKVSLNVPDVTIE